MKQKLKYINLFEDINKSLIPGAVGNYDGGDSLNIYMQIDITEPPPIYNKLTDEVIDSIEIFNTKFYTLNTFNLLTHVNSICIDSNSNLHTLTGFDSLELIIYGIDIQKNPNLVTLSIPSTLIKSVNYIKRGDIFFEDEYIFKSPELFVNSDVVIQDCIDKFNPELHSGVVVTQIIENLELWGTDETKERVYNHIAPYCSQEQLELLPDTYKHLYHSDFNNTGAKSVAKVATGVTYGLF